MTFNEMLKELSSLTFQQRQELIARAMELDDDEQLSAEEEAKLDARFKAHEADPSSSLPWEQMKAMLLNRPGK